MALRLYRAVVGQEDALRAALDDGWRDRGAGDVGKALRREQHRDILRSEEHTSELQSLMRISYAVFCLKKKTDSTLTRLSINPSYQHRQNKRARILEHRK